MFVYTYYIKGHNPAFYPYLKVEGAVGFAASHIEDMVSYDVKNYPSGSTEHTSLREVEKFCRKVRQDPTLENGTKLIEMYEASKGSLDQTAIKHSIEEVPLTKDYGYG